MPLALSALAARGGDGFRLGIDRGDALEHVPRFAVHDHLLLLLEEGEHFAVFLQFFPQGFDEVL